MSTVEPLTAEECATINSYLDDREKRHIPTTYLEDIQSIRPIINRFRGAWEIYNNIPLFREPSLGSTHESESQYTLAQRLHDTQATFTNGPSMTMGQRLRTETQEVCDASERLSYGDDLQPADMSANKLIEEAARKEYIDDSGNFKHIGGHPSDVYCNSCSPANRLAPELEDVGTFDVGLPDLPDAANEPLHGLHFSSGKPPLALIPRSGTRALAEVFAFGAMKYAMHNWRKGILWSELLNSAKRHLDDFIDGEDNDRESGITHLAHAAWNCFALIEYLTTHPELDDRYLHPWGEEVELFPDQIPLYKVELINQIDRLQQELKELNDRDVERWELREDPFRLSV